MAVRTNLLEMNDLETGIRLRRKDLENLKLFEMNQSITEEEKRLVAEERRKTNMHIEFLETRLQALKKNNVAFVFIYIGILLLAIIFHLRCVAIEDQNNVEEVYESLSYTDENQDQEI